MELKPKRKENGHQRHSSTFGRTHVLHIIPRLTPGGIPSLVESTLYRLRDNGFTCSLLAFRSKPDMRRRLEAEGIRVFIEPRGLRPRDLRSVVSVRNVIRKSTPDIVHSHTLATNFHTALALGYKRPQPKFVAHVHGVNPHRNQLHRLGEAFIRHRADRLLACSRFVFENQMFGRAGLKASVLLNGIEPSSFGCREGDRNLVLGETRFHAEDKICITVARLEWRKDIQTLLKAAHLLREQRLRFVIVGEGEERALLESLARQLKIDTRVQFIGEREDVPRWLGGSDIFVLTSVSEGLGIAILEAMATGLPVVATQVGGIPELLHPDYSTMVPSGDPSSLARALSDWSRSDSSRLECAAEASRRAVEQRFSLDRFVDELQETYRRLLNRV